MLGEGLRARSVRGEGGDSDRCPEPSAGLIGEGQPLRGCEGFGGTMFGGVEWDS